VTGKGTRCGAAAIARMIAGYAPIFALDPPSMGREGCQTAPSPRQLDQKKANYDPAKGLDALSFGLQTTKVKR
jgi:hypothetical protein